MLAFLRWYPTTIPNIPPVIGQQPVCGRYENPVGRLLLAERSFIRRRQYPTEPGHLTINTHRIFPILNDEPPGENTRPRSRSLERQEDGNHCDERKQVTDFQHKACNWYERS